MTDGLAGRGRARSRPAAAVRRRAGAGIGGAPPRSGRPGRAARSTLARRAAPRTASRQRHRAGCARHSSADRTSSAGPGRPPRCARRRRRRRRSGSGDHVLAEQARPCRRPAARAPSASLAVVLLPEPDSPTMPERLARRQVERDAVDRADVTRRPDRGSAAPGRVASSTGTERSPARSARQVGVGRRAERRPAGVARPAPRR